MSTSNKRPSSSGTEAPQFYPGIDSLRAVAILFVCFHHYFNQSYAEKILLGNAGVDIFFVISGFLITGILLHYKKTTSLAIGLKTFYLRRALRVFPLYYFYIAIVGALLWRQLNPESFASLMLYFVNFYRIADDTKLPYPFLHFWSLSVEEQFYLLWPAFILVIDRRFLKPIILGIIFTSIAFSLLAPVVLHMPLAPYMHLVSCMQALALGGLLALLKREKSRSLTAVNKNAAALITLSVLGFIACLVTYRDHLFMFTFLRTFASIAAFVAITIIVAKPLPAKSTWRTLYNRFLSNRILQFIGKISYGIYVYHIIVQYLLGPVIASFVKAGTWAFYGVTCTVFMAVTIFISYLSFRYVESPINRLKKRFTITDNKHQADPKIVDSGVQL